MGNWPPDRVAWLVVAVLIICVLVIVLLGNIDINVRGG